MSKKKKNAQAQAQAHNKSSSNQLKMGNTHTHTQIQRCVSDCVSISWRYTQRYQRKKREKFISTIYETKKIYFSLYFMYIWRSYVCVCVITIYLASYRRVQLVKGEKKESEVSKRREKVTGLEMIMVQSNDTPSEKYPIDDLPHVLYMYIYIQISMKPPVTYTCTHSHHISHIHTHIHHHHTNIDKCVYIQRTHTSVPGKNSCFDFSLYLI